MQPIPHRDILLSWFSGKDVCISGDGIAPYTGRCRDIQISQNRDVGFSFENGICYFFRILTVSPTVCTGRTPFLETRTAELLG